MKRHLYYYTVVDQDFDAATRLFSGDPSGWLPEPATQEGPYWRVTLRADGALPRPIAAHPAEVQVGIPVSGFEEVAIDIGWHSARADRLLPVLQGELQLQKLAGEGCHLSLLATYRPPLAVVGDVGDAAVGRRVAEACVRRFVLDVAEKMAGVTLPA